MGAHELAFVGLAGSSIGTVLGLPMLWPRADRARDVQLLGVSMVMMSIIAGLISARLAGLAPWSAATEVAINILGLSSTPMLVIYARYAAALPISRSQAWLWLPALGYATLVMMQIAAGAEPRLSFAWLAPFICGFTVLAAATLWRHGRERRPVLVPAEALVAFMGLVNIAQLVRMEFGYIAPVRALVPMVMSLGFAAIAGYAAWRATTRSTVQPSTARYERSSLDRAGAEQLLERIDRALTHDRLHARVDLTLAHLSGAVGATPHQVSEALNRFAGTSFADVVTRHRVADVKAQLLDPANDRYTIEGIGASAGFGSRSALYTAFKRLEGTTPTEFRKRRSPPLS